MHIHENLVALNMECTKAEEVIQKLCELLCQEGAVQEEYCRAVLEREQTFPTGLPTEPIRVALPHGSLEYVNYPALAVGILNKPVAFYNMAEPEEALQVEIVFLLANNDPEGQVEILKRLVTVFGQPEKLTTLKALQAPKDVVTMLKSELINNSSNRGC